MIYCKYEIPKEVWETLEPTLENENCNKVVLGNLCIEKDADGNCIKQNPNVAIDILWASEPKEEFSQYEVFPNPIGQHTFAGAEALYTKRFCDFNPDSPFCVIPPTEI